MVSSADERRHLPGPGPHWEESWNFDFVSSDGRLAGYARLGLRAADRRAWWWTAIVGKELPVVLVRDHDVTAPKPGTLEIRASGLWAEPVCETPLEHWGLGLEALAVSLDDPTDAYGAERGDPTPLGLDLEWERTGAPAGLVAVDGGEAYRVPAAVHGEVLVGSQRLMVAGTGTWAHAWGARDWWAPAGTPTGLNERGLVDGAVYQAPVQVPAPDGRITRVARAVCRTNGHWAWVERVSPPGASSPA